MMLKLNLKSSLFLLCSLTLPFVVNAQSLQELERRCENTRQRLIAPLRQDAINECIASRSSRASGDARQHCERFYADFGQAGRTQQGGFRQRMFHDIPECQAFYDAEQSTRRR